MKKRIEIITLIIVLIILVTLFVIFLMKVYKTNHKDTEQNITKLMIIKRIYKKEIIMYRNCHI